MEFGLRLSVTLCSAVVMAVPCDAFAKILGPCLVVLYSAVEGTASGHHVLDSTLLGVCAGGGAGLVFHARPKSHFRRKGQVAPRVSYSPLRPLKTQNSVS